MLENDYKGVINPDAPVFSAYDRDELPPVPEPDRCTLRCTGVPTKVEEKEILAHFQTFGRVICVRRLASAPAGGAAMNAVSATGEERKTYNEFLFQFETRADALKCVGSPKSVLDNRFIRIHMAPYNLIPLSEVPTYIAEGRDAAINGIRIAGPDGAGDHANLNSPRASNPVKEKAAAALKQKYEDLLALRQSQEAIFKKKESLFQVRLCTSYSNINAISYHYCVRRSRLKSTGI